MKSFPLTEKKTPLQFIGRSLANLQNATMQKHLRRAHKHKNSSTLKKGWFSDPAYVNIPLILKKKNKLSFPPNGLSYLEELFMKFELFLRREKRHST